MIHTNKYSVVAALAKDAAANGEPQVLDAGCRDCVLRRYLPERAIYSGFDLVQNDAGSVDRILSAEKPLPFEDGSFSVVAALDLIEHLDNLHGGLEELLRVARLRLIVALPNMSHFLFRLRYLFTGRLGRKYDLDFDERNNLDRHRWVVGLRQTDRYMRAFAKEHQALLRIIRVADASPRRKLLAQIGNACRLPATLWTWVTVYVVDKPQPRP